MIKKIVLTIFLILMPLFAKHYDSNVMAIEAKLFPKIALLEQHIKNSNSTYIRITILAREVDFNAAEKFKEKIKSTYPNGILKRDIIIKISKFKPNSTNSADAVIVLNHEDKKLKAIANWANKNRVVSFAFDPFHLRYGLLASIYFGKSTKPYLNHDVIKKYNFVFNHYLLQLSKFYGK